MVQNNECKKDVVIVLNDSTYAHAFGEGNRVHQDEFDRAIRLIDEQMERFSNYMVADNELSDRYHNTISILGERGTGKTSFLRSVLTFYEEHAKNNKVEILGVIDPTILEQKGHIFLYIVSLINEEVCKKLDKEECAPNSDAFCLRRDWKQALAKLAKGLPSLDTVGTDYKNNNWQDDDFIMEKGLGQVDAALHLELNFHRLINKALQILEKKFFMLAFDDIDIDMQKGWPVLECIRKYLTTPQIITLLSGNLRFYGNNIRIQQWVQFEPLEKYEADYGANKLMMNELKAQVNEIESQYLIKIMKVWNRIHLHSIHDAISTYGKLFFVKDNSNPAKDIPLSQVYSDMLKAQGIKSNSAISIFSDYILGLSLRSQINILQNYMLGDNDNPKSLAYVDVFLSHMYVSQIDYELIVNNPRMCNIVILLYLVRNGILNNSYLLFPNSEDAGINACVTGLTLLFMEKQRTNPSFVFDYMLRIGYIRNVYVTSNNNDILERMCPYAGAFQDVSLKSLVGMSMGYLASQKGYDLKEHILVYGLSSAAKERRKDDIVRIDDAFSTDDVKGAQRTVGFIPLCALKYAGKNESRLYYSMFNLLAAIGQILKNGTSKHEIQIELDKMQLLRYYSILDESTKATGIEEELDLTEMADDDENDNSVEHLVESIQAWIGKYDKCIIPPYTIGRIMGRFYSTAPQIKNRRLGDTMYQSVISLLNACLLEESLELLDECDVPRLNNSNATNSDKIFFNNLKKIVVAGIGDKMKFTKWLAECPLMQAFFTPNFWNGRQEIAGRVIERNQHFEEVSVYEILNQVGLRIHREPVEG